MNIVYLNCLSHENTFTKEQYNAVFKEFFQNVCVDDACKLIEKKDLPLRDDSKELPGIYYSSSYFYHQTHRVSASISDFLEKANLIGKNASEKLFPGVRSANVANHTVEEKEFKFWISKLIRTRVATSPKPSFDALSSIAGIPKKLSDSELFEELFDEIQEKNISIKF